MAEIQFYDYLLAGWFILAAIVAIILRFVPAPYGRHLRPKWGPGLRKSLGWMIMEAPAAIVFALFFAVGCAPVNVPHFLFFLLWEAHYLHRSFLYPFLLRGRKKTMPLSVVAMGATFNLVNSYLNGRYLFTFSGGYPEDWLLDPRFIAGVILFISGYILNRYSDQILRGLRGPEDDGYRIPSGGFYRWVTCPNYLGEITQWCGWALATWSLAGLSFAFWTLIVLSTRARSHHLWYRRNFPDYPPERRVLLPGLW